MAIVTYIAPADDALFVEMFGFRFVEGEPVEIEDTPENAMALGKLRANQHFEVLEDGASEAAPAKKRGRPFKTED